MTKDMVNHPKHYADSEAPCECIEVIHYVVKGLPPEVAVGVGNLQKYIWRLGKKAPDQNKDQSLEEKILEDMEKSKWYLNDAISEMKKVINRSKDYQNINVLEDKSKIKFQGSKEECENWIEENTKNSWLEEYLKKYFAEHSSYTLSRRGDMLGGIRIGVTEVCKKILEEVRTHEGIEQMTKFYMGEIIKDLGVKL